MRLLHNVGISIQKCRQCPQSYIVSLKSVYVFGMCRNNNCIDRYGRKATKPHGEIFAAVYLYVSVKSTKSKQQSHTWECVQYQRLNEEQIYASYDLFIGWFFCLSKSTIGAFDLCTALHSYCENCRMSKHILHSSTQSRSKLESDRCYAT